MEKTRTVDLKEKKFARLSLRIIAYMIDVSIFLTPILVYVNIWFSQEDLNNFMSLALLFIPMLVTLCILFHAYTILSIASFGKTFGGALCGLVVTDVYGNFISDKRSFFRATIGSYVSLFLFGVGFLWVKIDKKRQGWHDKVADTYVHVEKNRVRIGVFAILLLFAMNYFLFISAIKAFDRNQKLISNLSEKLFVIDLISLDNQEQTIVIN